jgi:hypothetical protein
MRGIIASVDSSTHVLALENFPGTKILTNVLSIVNYVVNILGTDFFLLIASILPASVAALELSPDMNNAWTSGMPLIYIHTHIVVLFQLSVRHTHINIHIHIHIHLH